MGVFRRLLLTGVVAAVMSVLAAPIANAATEYWTPGYLLPYPSNWHCTLEDYNYAGVDVCLINSHNGTEPVYRAVMVVYNTYGVPNFNMSGAAINLWASSPTPARLVRDDGCYDSALLSQAACYGRSITRSALCRAAPGTSQIKAIGAINIPSQWSSRITQSSGTRAPNC